MLINEDAAGLTELDARDLTALKLYFETFDYRKVAKAIGLTYSGTRSLVLRAVKQRAAELLFDVDQLIVAQVGGFLNDLAVLEPMIHRADGQPPSLAAIDSKLKIWGRLSALLGLDQPVKVQALVATVTRDEALAIRDARWAALAALPRLVDSAFEEPAGPVQVTDIMVQEPTIVAEVQDGTVLDQQTPDEGLSSPWDEPDEEGAPIPQERYGDAKPKQYRAPIKHRGMSG